MNELAEHYFLLLFLLRQASLKSIQDPGNNSHKAQRSIPQYHPLRLTISQSSLIQGTTLIRLFYPVKMLKISYQRPKNSLLNPGL